MRPTLTYWCRQGLNVTIDGPEGQSSVAVDKPFAVVGSHEEADVVLADTPQRALYLHATDQGIYWIHLQPPEPAEYVTGGWLHEGERVSVGPHQLGAGLTKSSAIGAAPTADWLAKGSAHPPFPVVEISAHARVLGQRVLTRRLTVVGRRKPATLGLSSRSVSISHCILYFDMSKLWAIDLLSTGGISVDDQPVEAAAVPTGSSVAIGLFELKFLHLSDPTQTEYVLGKVGGSPAPSVSGIIRVRHEEIQQADLRKPRPSDVESASGDLDRDRAVLLADRQALESEKQAWEKKRLETDMELANRSAELERRLREFEAERDAFLAQKKLWESERQRVEKELAKTRAQLQEEAERLKAQQ
jgi:pSer/pThr/pTyr-binding forkhead associated (FHA) protein